MCPFYFNDWWIGPGVMILCGATTLWWIWQRTMLERWLKVLESIGAAVILFIGAALLAPQVIGITFNSIGCEKTEYQRIPSPDGRFVATEIYDDCGALGSLNREVFITKHSGLLRYSVMLLYLEKKTDIKLSWEDAKTLVVRIDRERNSIDNPPPALADSGEFRVKVKGPGEK